MSIQEQHSGGLDRGFESKAELSRQIALISGWLREMYSLDLKIYGAQNARAEQQAARDQMIDQAEVLFYKVKAALADLDAQGEPWSAEERAVLQSILDATVQHAPLRQKYPGA